MSHVHNRNTSPQLQSENSRVTNFNQEDQRLAKQILAWRSTVPDDTVITAEDERAAQSSLLSKDDNSPPLLHPLEWIEGKRGIATRTAAI
ncbi:hypothetical protein BROUX41_006713 [Berkeleyomyces rouxiae]